MQCNMEEFKMNLISGPWLSHISGLKVLLVLCSGEPRLFLGSAFINHVRNNKVPYNGKENLVDYMCWRWGERERNRFSSCGELKINLSPHSIPVACLIKYLQAHAAGAVKHIVVSPSFASGSWGLTMYIQHQLLMFYVDQFDLISQHNCILSSLITKS